MLEREFYMRDAEVVAQALLGKVLVHETPQGVTKGRIVETEAYKGWMDRAAHSYQNLKTERTKIQFGPGGFAYIYFIYGMHYCMNIVTNRAELPEAVLIRALEPTEGIALMCRRRNTDKVGNLCNGPGKLCAAMGIDKTCYGLDLCASSLYLEEGSLAPGEKMKTTRRINVDYAGEAREYPWRYLIDPNPHVSVKKLKAL